MGIGKELAEELQNENEKLRADIVKVIAADAEEVKALKLQLGEVTSHRDRLRDMLNEVRGKAYQDVFSSEPSNFAALVIKIVEDGKPVQEMSLEERINNRQHLLERCYLELYASSRDEREHKREDCLKAARAIAARIAAIDYPLEKLDEDS